MNCKKGNTQNKKTSHTPFEETSYFTEKLH
jgi:hypothetical protein